MNPRKHEQDCFYYRDPVSHTRKMFLLWLVNKKATRKWEKSYGLLMKKNVCLVWVNRLLGEGQVPFRVCRRDYKALQKMGVI